MSELVYLVLATLGSYDILRRFLPAKVPVLAGKIMCVLIPMILQRYAPHAILLSLCVPGVLLLLRPITAVESFTPWGTVVTEAWRSIRKKNTQPARGVGNRVPRL